MLDIQLINRHGNFIWAQEEKSGGALVSVEFWGSTKYSLLMYFRLQKL